MSKWFEKYKLYQGDCIELMKSIEDKSIDFILCDLPYGTTKCSWDIVLPFDKLWEQYNRIIKDNGCIALFGIEPFSSNIRMSNLSMYRYDWYWHKTLCSNFVMGRKQPFFKIETISIFYKSKPLYNPQMKKGKPYIINESHIKQNGMQQKYCFSNKKDIINDGIRYPDNLIQINSISGSKLHPTQKPIDLCEYLIKTYTNENDVVLDNCMGSGTTGIACINTDRRFIGIEKDEKYFNIAEKRIEETYNNKIPSELF